MPRSSFFWSMAAILCDVVARRTRPRAMPLATMTMKTQMHGFLNFYPRTVLMGLRSVALLAAGELRYKMLVKLFLNGSIHRDNKRKNLIPVHRNTSYSAQSLTNHNLGDSKNIFWPKQVINTYHYFFDGLHE